MSGTGAAAGRRGPERIQVFPVLYPHSSRFAHPTPDHVGVEAISSEIRETDAQGFRHSATFLVGPGYAYVGHIKCPLKNKWTLSWPPQRLAQDGFTGRLRMKWLRLV